MLPKPLDPPESKYVIIGGVSGLGKSMVHMFADHGANIVVGDLQDELGAGLEKELSIKAKYVDAFEILS